MLERLTAGITDEKDTWIDWVKTPDEIVEGVETVFSAVKDRMDAEEEVLKELYEQLTDLAEVGGEVVKWAVKLGALAAFAPFAALGAGYLGAIDEVKRNRTPISFCEGVAMGVMAERPDFISERFWMHEPADNDFFEYAGEVEQYYTNGALVLGYGYGKELQGPLAKVFWSDLRRVEDQSLIAHGDPTEENWGPFEWRNFYISIAAAFHRLHMRDE